MRKVVRSQTTARLKKLNAELGHVVHDPKDAEAIHDLRVSIRRLARELKVFQAWFEPGHEKRIRRRLRKLLAQCASVRNFDITLEVLRAAGWRSPELVAGLEEERRRTREGLARTLESWQRRDRVRKWRGELRVRRHAEAAEPGTSAEENPVENARGILPAMAEDFFRAGRDAARSDSSHHKMHQFRLKAKRMRYTLELFEPVYGRKMEEIMDSLKGLQEKLGAISDCATTLEMVSRDPGAAAAVRGLAAKRETVFRTYWKKRFGPRVNLQWKAVLSAADGKN